MSKYVMAMDLGTTSNRCLIFDHSMNVLSVAQKEFKQIYPKPGWVEHDANEIYASALGVCVEAMQKIGAAAADIDSIGITNQRETTVVWDKATGEPVYNAIVWQCRRTSEYADQLKERDMTDIFREKTGLIIDAYFSATKLRWILNNVSGVRERAERGELLFGTIDTWMIYKLTGGKKHITDYSNASRTMLYNIKEVKWDEDILRELDIPLCMLPQVVPSSEVYAETEPGLFGSPIRLAGIAGDQQAALFGQMCFKAGEAKNTYGTGGFLLMNVGEEPVYSKNGLLTTIAWGMNGRVSYALEGSVYVAGAAVQWLRDEMRLIDSAEDSEYMATKVSDTNGCYVVPAFTGLGAPYWDQYARGTIVGLTRGCNKYHIVRATLEAIAYQVNDVITAMEIDSGYPVSTLRVDGGACRNNFVLQTQANLCGKPVVRPSCIETTAMGAAYLAGLATGFWKDRDELKANALIDRSFTPDMTEEERISRIKGWKRAVKCSFGWAE